MIRLIRYPLVLLVLFLFAACENGDPETGSARPASDLTHVEGLGSIHFPNSGAPEAQDAFHRGVLLLHSFEYRDAAAAFSEAQQADSTFAMAYWGEAMTYNHPLWREVDVEAARETLARLAPTAEERAQLAGSHREQMYLAAVEALYGEGTKTERDSAYMNAMQALHEMHPEDDEARTFYALSVLGSLNGEREFETYERAADIAKPVFERNPNHPGAAHYIIHSYDDPQHAELGLEAAEAYSEIAPHAAHAQHMTTHIFVALGMWERVVENNIRAMETAFAAAAEYEREPPHCGHYSAWRHYGHLQLGEFDEAEALMDACYGVVEDGVASRGAWAYFADMRALHIIDTEDWALADHWTAEPPTFDVSNSPDGSVQPLTAYTFSNAFAAIRSGDAASARTLLERIPDDLGGDRVVRDELRGLLTFEDGDVDGGLAVLRDAAERESAFPLMFGPPTVVKPSWELLGEKLLDAGRNEAAAEAFGRQLDRTPGRRLTVRGATEAASMTAAGG
ncbi:MAG: hypothetical protein HKN17_05380 [Rhodothermales bacterium]|nr:hypothetical protein [Rhodothermales bacterium]